MPESTGYAPGAVPGNALAGRYGGMDAEAILANMRRLGWSQEGVNRIYELRGLANPPQVGSLEGVVFRRNPRGAFVDNNNRIIKGLDTKNAQLVHDAVVEQAFDPYRERTGISNFAGGLLNAVGSYVGGPVWTAATALADAGNKALGNDDGTSYTDGNRSGADRVGALVGTVAGSFNGPGSYGANSAPANGTGSSTPSGSGGEAPTDTLGGMGGWGGGNNSGLGVFDQNSGGMAGIGGGNAGTLANAGGIAGGAGVGNSLGGGSGNALGGSNAGGNSMGWDWGQIINTGATLLGGYLQGEGAKDAANASAAGSTAAIAESRRQYDQSRADQMPWLQAGQGALTQLQKPTANFQASPDYAFRRDEGTRDIGNSFSARGGAQSGNALRALDSFNSNLASGEFGNWWNRQASLAGVGQTSAQNLGVLGANTAANVGNALQNGANARASGVEGQTNAYTGALADLVSQYNRNRQPRWGYGG